MQVPAHGTRPTSERVRESLFARLDHWDVVAGARVLDLFAGSGGLGLEALSRGAQRVTLVDAAKGAAQTARANVAALGVSEQVHVVQQRAERFVAADRGPWDLVFIDPPYDYPADELDALLGDLAESAAPGALILVERDKHAADPGWPAAWDAIETKAYGSTLVHFAERPSAG